MFRFGCLPSERFNFWSGKSLAGSTSRAPLKVSIHSWVNLRSPRSRRLICGCVAFGLQAAASCAWLQPRATRKARMLLEGAVFII